MRIVLTEEESDLVTAVVDRRADFDRAKKAVEDAKHTTELKYQELENALINLARIKPALKILLGEHDRLRFDEIFVTSEKSQ